MWPNRFMIITFFRGTVKVEASAPKTSNSMILPALPKASQNLADDLLWAREHKVTSQSKLSRNVARRRRHI